ncbi:Transposon Ty3-G Gag-Pol polyprotein [Senna tora]|uniref:Transposon Ty3-G Gag-Pol polyprotein n=1 Tax=Senna tora TaxID=362788 RepID=A0A834T144_9FABA|nr:Transposon Ty3-G Gag-Pol polyprotein [Senna tora]
MAKGTRFARLEAVTRELQRVQATSEDCLTAIASSVADLESAMAAQREAMHNMDEMLQSILQVQSRVAESVSGGNQRDKEVQGFMCGKTMKVELPRFYGTDADDWCFKIVEFFQIYSIPEEQRIKIASLQMEGAAYVWYKWLIRNSMVQGWDEFLKALLLRFGKTLFDDPKAALKELKQTAFVAEYQAAFESLSIKVTGLSEQWLVSFFVVGLQDHLKCEVILAQPDSYYQAVSLAKMHEQKHVRLQQALKSFYSKTTYNAPFRYALSVPTQLFASTSKPTLDMASSSKPASGMIATSVVSNAISNAKSASLPVFKKLSAAELRDKRVKGLCYYCDDKYSLNHKCKPSFSLLVGQEELDELIGREAVDEEGAVEGEQQCRNEQLTPEISFNALEGQYHPSTLRLLGQCADSVVNILVDNGSKHNIIKSSVAHNLKLPLTVISPFKVLTGSGSFLSCTHKCDNVCLKVQGQDIVVDLYVLEIKGSDVVLGVQWLAELGEVMTNYKDLTMSFVLKGHKVELRGEPLIRNDPMTPTELHRLSQSDAISCLYHLQKVEHSLFSDLQVPSVVLGVLQKFSEVFEEPKSLPPKRDIDHTIVVEPNSKPVSVRPYRYPHFHKAEIERLVEEMKNSGIIRDKLLKKNHLCWNDDAEAASKALKLHMTKAPVLALPDFSKLFEVETDASTVGVGAVLSQGGCDEMETLSTRQEFYLTKLMGFDYEIVYRTGASNRVADALSRCEEKEVSGDMKGDFLSISNFQHELLVILKQLNNESRELKELHDKFVRGELDNSYSVQDGILRVKGRLFVPDEGGLKPKILQFFHDSKIGEHGGVRKTHKAVTEIFYWPFMLKDVEDYVKQCAICQQTKYSTDKKQGLLQPLPIPHSPWEDLTMDFIVGLPKSHDYSAILVVVDRFTKMAHFAGLKTGFTASTVATVFTDMVVKLHGFPKPIVIDRDSIFLSKFWKNLMLQSGTKLMYNSAYHPETDGQTEVLNRCLEQYLRAFSFDQPSSWYRLLPWAELWYNSSFHSSIGMTPFQALYGVNPAPLPSYSAGSVNVETLEDLLIVREQLHEQLRAHLLKAQNRMKKFADKKRKEAVFAEQDLVLVKLHHYRQQSVAKRLSYKLSKRFFGPFLVLKRVGSVAYKLQLPKGSRVHPIFHVSLLKRFHGNPMAVVADIPEDFSMFAKEPERLVDKRIIKKDDKEVAQVLVEWSWRPREEATWEDLGVLTEAFPHLNLEDKVAFDDGGNDTHIDVEACRSERKRRRPTWMGDYLMS